LKHLHSGDITNRMIWQGAQQQLGVNVQCTGQLRPQSVLFNDWVSAAWVAAHMCALRPGFWLLPVRPTATECPSCLSHLCTRITVAAAAAAAASQPTCCSKGQQQQVQCVLTAHHSCKVTAESQQTFSTSVVCFLVILAAGQVCDTALN
jgi:hypothetical protein